ncbi:TIGR02679 family protein [Metaplanococcus flavidus]|uniref:TIGR02679 family protein n=1 Tax=Metaplanococcus flavidus TaxID=569883 RepID=A0ABW3LDR6_9BACL
MKIRRNDLTQQAVDYFSAEKVYKKLFAMFVGKVESFGRIGGAVKLDNFNDKELEPVALFFGTSVSALKKKNTISLISFEKQLQKTKFEGVRLHELLEIYFGEAIYSKKEVKDSKREAEDKKLGELKVSYPSLTSYFTYLSKRNSDSHWIIRLVTTDDFTRAVGNLAEASRKMPEKYERLPFFSQRISGNPHTFDLATVTGKLLIHWLQFEQNGSGAPPSHTEAVNELLLSCKILRDDITNFVSFSNLLGKQQGRVHPVWKAAMETESVINVPLRELLKIDHVAPATGKKVYIVENSGVFSSLLDIVPNAPLVCTHGQFKLAGLKLVDLLANSGCEIYYAGDFDPEGVAMAVRLLERLPENVRLWRMDVDSYKESLPSVELGERLGKLTNIMHPLVVELVSEMNRIGKAGYQEALLEKMAGDLVGNIQKDRCT